RDPQGRPEPRRDREAPGRVLQEGQPGPGSRPAHRRLTCMSRPTATATDGQATTCGTGLAQNAAVPAKLSELFGAKADVLATHAGALDGDEPAARQARDAYRSGVSAYCSLDSRLRAAATEMASYRDLP